MIEHQVLNAIRKLIQQGQTANQEVLIEQLAQQGLQFSQSKISRLLREVGAFKAKNAQGELVYCLPKESAPPSRDSSLSHLVLEIAHNDSLIVLRTSPGAAQLVARVIDYQQQQLPILGTIAGDDSIFVAAKSTQLIDEAVAAIENLLLVTSSGLATK